MLFSINSRELTVFCAIGTVLFYDTLHFRLCSDLTKKSEMSQQTS